MFNVTGLQGDIRGQDHWTLSICVTFCANAN